MSKPTMFSLEAAARVELWHQIAGYEGRYEVSNHGRVRSLARVVMKTNGEKYHVRERIMKLVPDRKGYLLVGLRKGGDRKTHSVHRLVAIAFIGKPETGQQVNHRDSVKTNNCVENLEWCTSKENLDHSIRDGNIHGRPKRAVIGTDGTRVYKFESASEAGRWGFDQGNIVAVLKGRQKTHAGLVWRYATEGKRL